MIRKHAILTGIITAIILLFIAAAYYPGGSQQDIHSIGFDWKNNYLSNLFGNKAINGADNPSRFWAVAGMFFLCVSFALFFYQFSKKIPIKSAAGVIRYAGIASMVFTFLAVTPYHDLMIALASTAALTSIFYITVFAFKSKLLWMKIFCVVCMIVFYFSNYIYYTRTHLEILPVMQKVSLLLAISWMISIEYFTTAADFFELKKYPPRE